MSQNATDPAPADNRDRAASTTRIHQTKAENDSQSTRPTPFADGAEALLASGLGSPLPVPFGQKAPPPSGYTGAGGIRPSGPDVEEWRAYQGGDNIALRLAPDVIGVDVDAYDGRAGATTLAAFEADHGALASTWRLTSRDDGVSGIRLYRLPEGVDEADLGDMGPGVEVIRAGHRYGMSAGSVHPSGRVYEWVTPDGTRSLTPPHVDDLPVLTTAQVEGLRRKGKGTARTTVSTETLDAHLEAHPQLVESLRNYLTKAGEGHLADVAAHAAMRDGDRLADGDSWGNTARGAGLVGDDLCRAHRLDATAAAIGEPEVYVEQTYATFAASSWPRYAVDRGARDAKEAAKRGPALPADWAAKVAAAQLSGKASTTGRSTTKGVVEGAPRDPAGLLGGRAMTDVNLVDVFAAMYADTVRYVPQTRTWLRWTGSHWKPTDEADIVGLSSLFALDLVQTIAKQGDPERSKQAAGRQNRARVEAIVALAKGNALVRVDRDRLDRHPHLLNTPSGIVDLRTGDLAPHDPDLLMTKVTSARYVPGATHPDWDKVLDDLDPEVADFLQINLGQATTGEPPNDDKATVLYGLGGNAKTTLAGACMKALGDESDGYARLISERVLVVDGKGNQHPTELTELIGVRLAVLEELPNRGELSMERLKKITGETIEARKIRADTIRWRASHTLFLTTNYHPRVRETDVGSWRRVRLVDFPIRYVRTQEEITGPNVRLGDVHLRPRVQKARAQQEAVLAWLVAGARRYYEMGQQLPEEPPLVQRATQAWRDSSDPLGRFLSEHCEAAGGWCIPGDDLFKHFRAALLEHGHVPWTDQTFAERMKGQPLLTSGRVTKGRPRISEAPHESRPQVSHHPDDALVTVTYKDGQQVSAYLGLRWREGGHR